MRDYQRTKNNPYILPHQLYRQTLALIRDYPRLKEDYEDAITATKPHEGGSSSGRVSDPTGQTAVRIDSMHTRIKAIEEAQRHIPKEYMKGVWQNIVYNKRYPDDANARTYGRYKAQYVYAVAFNMGWV